MTDWVHHMLSKVATWLVVAYVILACVLIAVVIENGKANRALAHSLRDEAIRQADQNSQRASAKSQCLNSIPALKRINLFVDGVATFAQIVQENSLEVLQATAPTDPQYDIRAANYRRVSAAVKNVRGVKFPVPTVASCDKLGRP